MSADPKTPAKDGSKKRGRPSNAEKAAKAETASATEQPKPPQTAPRVNQDPMSDEQEQALHAHHANAYQKLLEKFKTAQANLKNGAKLAKAEGVPLKAIKEYLAYQTEEGQQELREDLARKAKIARWHGLPINTQVNFLDEVDRTPIDERTKEDGKRAGLRGEKAEPPRHVPPSLISHWMEGWHAGQAILAQRGIKQLDPEQQKAENDAQRKEDAQSFDDTLPGEGAAAH